APSSSPRFHDLPYFNFTAGQPINYRIGAEDPDGHEQEVSLAAPHYATTDVYKELLESGFQLQKDGTILWENPVTGKWLVNFKVSEKINGVLTGAYISWEAIINVSDINGNQAPTFGVLEPKVVRAGETLSFQIEASDAASQEVNLSAFGPTFGQGATFTQTASGSLAKGTYSWAVPQDATGNYYVQFLATDNQNPSLSSQTNVAISIVECNEFAATYTVVAQPCAGSSNGKLSLSGTEQGYSPYEYSLDNGLTFQSSTDFENLAPGAYTGIVRYAAGCTSNSVAITLEEAPLPEVTLSLPATVCADAGAVALNGGSPAGGVYQGAGVENGFFYPEKAGAGIHTIQYTYTNSNGCSNTAAQDLRVNETLVADAGDDAVVYASNGGSNNGGGTGYGSGNGNNKGQGAENGGVQSGRCATLTAGASGGTSPYTYKWSTGETAQSITVCPSETTTYLLTVTDAVGCTATSQTQVVVEDMQNSTDANPSGNSTASADTKAKISAYPNPLTETSQLKINLPEADQITVEITDMSGNVVKNLYTGPIAAKQTMSFDLNSKLGNGKVYIARVKGAKGVHHCRLMHK
ncbi:MAG: T9SS type A sorting domain-containing protein, partial [Bacteroidetes bacterium]|nr:T9SS type A sorting domain-containing protein [Bacteroidota bacterium]